MTKSDHRENVHLSIFQSPMKHTAARPGIPHADWSISLAGQPIGKTFIKKEPRHLKYASYILQTHLRKYNILLFVNLSAFNIFL